MRMMICIPIVMLLSCLLPRDMGIESALLRLQILLHLICVYFCYSYQFLFFDLSIPYSYPTPLGGKEIVLGNKLRPKLATKAMELSYVGIAHNHSIEGVMSEKDCCTIPLLTLGSLIKAAPRLSSSVGFHRDLLGVPRATPFRQYTHITVKLESKAQCLSLNSGISALKSYDIVAVRLMNPYAFNQACMKAEVDIISINFSNMPFRLMHPSVKAAIKRGIYFERDSLHLLT